MDAVKQYFTFVLENVTIIDPPLVTSESIGMLRLGTTVKQLPQTMDGLYDKMVIGETEEGPDGKTTSIVFHRNGKEIINATADEDGKLFVMEVCGQFPGVNVNRMLFRVGDSIADLKRQKGVVSNGAAGWAAVFNGVNFNEDVNGKIYSITIDGW
ncbi:MAG: hypothetical protein NC344_08580 [Bacteroidales bacterium]|nr:hypothetical protein [Bacteroidales bacterium]MCM1147865.1 hypothetical protein [Bacteroidales bacterium]MCM1206708.1 hypothetical protein [Bacillota bacterium]MCM1510904.1 hypothetical protein [Clostridium sp.]